MPSVMYEAADLHAWDLSTAMDIAVKIARRNKTRQRIVVRPGTDQYGDYRFEIEPADG